MSIQKWNNFIEEFFFEFLDPIIALQRFVADEFELGYFGFVDEFDAVAVGFVDDFVAVYQIYFLPAKINSNDLEHIRKQNFMTKKKMN